MSEVKARLVRTVSQQLASHMGLPSNVVPMGLMASAPAGGQLGNWGTIFGELIKGAGQIYGQKELLKQQEKLAKSLAEAEAKKMLAEVELQLAQASSLQRAAELQKEQNELQKILRDIQFSGVQKWLLGGAGALTLVLVAMVGYRKFVKPKRAVRRRR